MTAKVHRLENLPAVFIVNTYKFALLYVYTVSPWPRTQYNFFFVRQI
jgi:hypothetical protein